ncbi:MAG: insulinase family protein [Deinococcus sp.]|nr:insulinase family protein [Deinococcus sp.]
MAMPSSPTEPRLLITLPNHLRLVAERIPSVRSTAVTLLLEVGVAQEPEAQQGVSNLLADMVFKGTGQNSARDIVDHLDFHGVSWGAQAGTEATRFDLVMLGRELPQVLPLFAALITRPSLPAAELEVARTLALQEIQHLEDEPAQKLAALLQAHYYGPVLGRIHLGTPQTVAQLDREALLAHHHAHYRPSRAILAVAGDIDLDRISSLVQDAFGQWEAGGQKPLAPQPPPAQTRLTHVPKDTEQTHIGVAFPSLVHRDPNYYVVQLAISVLSGTSGRLFTEVRERRGLVYTVFASHRALHDAAMIYSYAGTTTEKAQETLQVLLTELQKLSEGVRPDELERARAGVKSALVMQAESAGARCRNLAADVFYRGRCVPPEEVLEHVAAVEPQHISQYFGQHPPGPFTVTVLGREPLGWPEN